MHPLSYMFTDFHPSILCLVSATSYFSIQTFRLSESCCLKKKKNLVSFYDPSEKWTAITTEKYRKQMYYFHLVFFIFTLCSFIFFFNALSTMDLLQNPLFVELTFTFIYSHQKNVNAICHVSSCRLKFYISKTAFPTLEC